LVWSGVRKVGRGGGDGERDSEVQSDVFAAMFVCVGM